MSIFEFLIYASIGATIGGLLVFILFASIIAKALGDFIRGIK